MRVPEQQRRSFRLRAWIIGFVVILIVLLFSLRGLASFYTDYLVVPLTWSGRHLA